MNQKFTRKASLGKAILFGVLGLLFPTIAGVIIGVTGIAGDNAKIVQIAVTFFGVLVGFFLMKKSGISLKKYGFEKLMNTKVLLLGIPVLLIEIIPFFAGLRKEIDFSYIFLMLLFTIGIGFSEEIYYRGLVLRELTPKNEKYAILVSSMIFGFGHLGNLASGADLFKTALQIAFAILFGFVCAELVLLTKSLSVPILWHIVHNFFAYITEDKIPLNFEMILLGAQMIIMLIFAIYLWKQLDGSIRPEHIQ